jgi:hypothetical protein
MAAKKKARSRKSNRNNVPGNQRLLGVLKGDGNQDPMSLPALIIKFDPSADSVLRRILMKTKKGEKWHGRFVIMDDDG